MDYYQMFDKKDELERRFLPCEKCNSTTFTRFEKVFADKTTHHELRCAKCDAYICYLPQPISLDLAKSFVINFGKYKDLNLTLGQLKAKDPSYFDWLKKNTTQKRLQKMIELLGL